MPSKEQKIKSGTRKNVWFRFYAEAFRDPKVQRLAPQIYKTWVNILCIACENDGKLPSVDDLSYHLRLSIHDAQQHFDELVLAGLIDILPNKSATPHNWDQRQFKSDTSADRVRKHREKKKETPCNVTGSVAVAAPEQSRAEVEVGKQPTSTDAERESEGSLESAPVAFAGEWIEIDREQYDAIVAEYGYLEFPRDLTQADKYLAQLNANFAEQPSMAERVKRVRGHLAAKNAEHKQLFAKMTAKATRKAMKQPEADVLPFKVTTPMFVKPAPEPEYDGRWAAGGANV